MPLISRDNYFKGRDRKFALELTDEMRVDADKIIAKASELLHRIGVNKCFITSGWRPIDINKAEGGSPKSQHIYCRAIDIADPTKVIGLYCVENIEQLAEIGLWLESLVKTHASDNKQEWWVHLQTQPPKSGARIFLP